MLSNSLFGPLRWPLPVCFEKTRLDTIQKKFKLIMVDFVGPVLKFTAFSSNRNKQFAVRVF